MANISACIFLFRRKPHLQVLLAHPGGPHWQDKDEDAWSVPIGKIQGNEEPIAAAKRGFEEALGFIPEGDYLELGSTKQKGIKTRHAWAVEYQIPDNFIFSPGYFEMEWPPDSGQIDAFRTIDRIEYFGVFEAMKKINPAQKIFINCLINHCSAG